MASDQNPQIVSPSVRRHFMRHPSDEVQILVALDVAQPDLSDIVAGRALTGTESIAPVDRAAMSDLSGTVKKRIEALGIKIQNYLENAQTFVVNLSADQVDQVAKIPGISEISVNSAIK